jgi:hypothetical protein
MSLSCFVYYRVAAASVVEAGRAVDAMQAQLRDKSGVAGRLLRRADDPATWMEIYEGVTDVPTFEALLERLVAEHGLERLLAPGESRHVERFLPCA